MGKGTRSNGGLSGLARRLDRAMMYWRLFHLLVLLHGDEPHPYAGRGVLCAPSPPSLAGKSLSCEVPRMGEAKRRRAGVRFNAATDLTPVGLVRAMYSVANTRWQGLSRFSGSCRMKAPEITRRRIWLYSHEVGHMPPGTSSKRLILQESLIPALERAGYAVQQRASIGLDLTGQEYIVDVLASMPSGCSFPISLQWRQISGTVEETIPFEAMTLAKAVRDSDSRFEKGYLVLAGSKWSLKEFLVNGTLQEYLRYGELISIMELDEFLTKINTRQL